MNYNEIYLQYQDKINKNIKSITSKKNLQYLQEDLQNEIYIYFIKLMQNYRANYNGKHIPLDAYLFKHINLKILSMCQNERKYINRNTQINDVYSPINNTNNEDLYVNVEIQELLTYVDKLPSPIKDIILLYSSGYKQQEIANILNISQSRVCLILSAIKKNDASKFDIESLLEYKLNLQESWDK